ncbi:hypothetical protein [Martelella mangrovi]|uniref:Uncharacterized protein n=1 Tax=Martelella mangrovi TaxID=1397477 RepID=A0ABV2IDY2_9HYPH
MAEEQDAAKPAAPKKKTTRPKAQPSSHQTNGVIAPNIKRIDF